MRREPGGQFVPKLLVEDFNVPEVKLIRAIHDAPGILDRLGSEKERYVSFIQYTLLRELQADNVVYHGLAGHFFVKGLAHALKVRILASWPDRVALEMQREDISREQAVKILRQDDEQRREWSMSLYDVDTASPELYDLVINVDDLTVEDAAEIICHTAKMKRFQTTPEAIAEIEERMKRYKELIDDE